MRAVLNGVTLAESERTRRVEGNHYFPAEDVNWEHLRPSEETTLCFWKGIASYYDAEVSGCDEQAVAWTYERPLPWARPLVKDRVAFWGSVEIEE